MILTDAYENTQKVAVNLVAFNSISSGFRFSVISVNLKQNDIEIYINQSVKMNIDLTQDTKVTNVAILH